MFIVLALGQAGIAFAQTYPTRPVRFLVGFPPGGAVDIVARTLAPALAENLRGRVVVDNRGGAHGIIGTQLVASAAPDGYTIGLVSVSTLVLNVLLYPNVPYHTLRDFTLLTTVGFAPLSIAVHPGVPARSTKELIALARSKPGMLTFGSPGAGGLQHLTIELLNSSAGIKITTVHYKGTGPAMIDVLGAQIDGIVSTIPAVLAPAKSGKMRVLAVTDEKRTDALPDVPTAREQGSAGSGHRELAQYRCATPDVRGDDEQAAHGDHLGDCDADRRRQARCRGDGTEDLCKPGRFRAIRTPGIRPVG